MSGPAPVVAAGLAGLLAGTVADVLWLGWSGWGTLGGAALGTAVGALLAGPAGDPGGGEKPPRR